MIRTKRLWLVVMALILAIAMIPITGIAFAGSSDEVPTGHHIQANEEQLELIGELWGEDITYGEFLEQVFPEVVEDMPEDIREQVYLSQMEWPDPTADYPQSGQMVGVTGSTR